MNSRERSPAMTRTHLMDYSPTTGLSLIPMEASSIRRVFSESADLTVRLYGNTAVVPGLTTTKGKFMGQDFASCERATDIFVKQTGCWQCVFTQLTRFTKK